MGTRVGAFGAKIEGSGAKIGDSGVKIVALVRPTQFFLSYFDPWGFFGALSGAPNDSNFG